MEENKTMSWTDLFIKVIIAIIIILFAVWMLSLSNRGITDSLSVLTDDVFAKNIERMKEVGKEYFTTERLPQKVGDVKVLTLEKMYDKKLILELKDKYGNACSAENSYVSIEKFETEYQMKVYLQCGEEADHIIVIMGCYDYCDTDICEKKDDKPVDNTDKRIEYEYKKSTGGHWTDYGNWSEWSKVSVTQTDYRQVEKKTVKEEYTYDKTITKTIYDSVKVTCDAGYRLTADGTKCYSTNTTYDYKEPTCPSRANEGWTLVGRNGFTCSYSKTTTAKENPTCPSLSGYTLTGRDGFTCSYSKTTTAKENPTCPSLSGYTLTGRNGFTCNYSKTTTAYADPTCPSLSGYTFTGRDGFTCNYSKSVTTPYQVPVVHQKTCYTQKVVIGCSGCAPVIQNIPYDCSTTTYETRYSTKTEYKSATASCPSGYSHSGNTCVKSNTSTTTKVASCPSGYVQSGNICVKSNTSTTTRTASCPSGYVQSGSACVRNTTQIDNLNNASCPSGYNVSGNRCSKPVTNYYYRNIIKSCANGYQLNADKTQCYKNVNTTQTVTENRDVIYYRYRVREYIGGTVDYKWSTSKEDKKLLDAGYKLTGRTR